MRRAMAVLTATAALVFGFSTAAAAAPTEYAYFTINATSELDAAAVDAAREWDKGTVVDLTTGTCSGSGCITISIADWPCGQGYAGCAAVQPDGSCLVEITPLALTYGDATTEAVVAHEVGHCLGLPHSDDTRSIMYWSMQPGYPNRITHPDRVNLDAIWTPTSI